MITTYHKLWVSQRVQLDSSWFPIVWLCWSCFKGSGSATELVYHVMPSTFDFWMADFRLYSEEIRQIKIFQNYFFVKYVEFQKQTINIILISLWKTYVHGSFLMGTSRTVRPYEIFFPKFWFSDFFGIKSEISRF